MTSRGRSHGWLAQPSGPVRPPCVVSVGATVASRRGRGSALATQPSSFWRNSSWSRWSRSPARPGARTGCRSNWSCPEDAADDETRGTRPRPAAPRPKSSGWAAGQPRRRLAPSSGLDHHRRTVVAVNVVVHARVGLELATAVVGEVRLVQGEATPPGVYDVEDGAASLPRCCCT